MIDKPATGWTTRTPHDLLRVISIAGYSTLGIAAQRRATAQTAMPAGKSAAPCDVIAWMIDSWLYVKANPQPTESTPASTTITSPAVKPPARLDPCDGFAAEFCHFSRPAPASEASTTPNNMMSVPSMTIMPGVESKSAPAERPWML